MSSILDQFNNGDQQEQGNQLIDTIEAAGLLLFLAWVIHRIKVRHHVMSGIVLLFSSVAALLVLVNSNYGDNSFMVWCFWSLLPSRHWQRPSHNRSNR